MKIAISQPTYLPWIGFFDLIDQVDVFVLLDDVQFVKHSFDQRNRLKSPTGLQWLTVPVRGCFKQRLCDVVIDRQFAQRHVRSVEMNYRRTRYFEKYYPRLTEILKDYGSGSLLVDLNVALVEWLAEELGVKTPMVRSSTLAAEGRRSARVVSLCKLLNAEDYVSPRSALYLLEDIGLFLDSGVVVWFQNYTHPTYEQRFPPFVAYASALDLLFSHGADSGQIMRSGRGPSFAPDQIRALASQPEVAI
jgi:hypothetical protein